MHNTTDTLCWLLEQAKKSGAQAADGLLVNNTDTATSCRLGQPEALEYSESTAVGLRVFCDDRQAIVSSTDLSKPALQQLAERAVTIARASTVDTDSTLADAALYPDALPELDLEDSFVPDATWLTERCSRAEDAALATQGITNSEGAEASYGRTTITLAAMDNDLRFAHTYSKTSFSVSVSVLAGEDTGMERDYEFSAARHHQDLSDPEAIGFEAARRTLARLNPRKLATRTMPVIFDPRVSRSLLGILANSISGSAIARGTSFLKDKMGSRIFAPGIVVCDDPLRARGLASRPFDAEGVQTSARNIIEDGNLTSWLLDVRTASKLGLTTTGHAARGLGSAPSPAASNLYMQPGSLSPNELIAQTGNGVYITETFGMGINTVTGDYSQGASGFVIENGTLSHPVSEITIAGKLADMFAGITPANDLEFRYATNAPTLRVAAMTVAGS